MKMIAWGLALAAGFTASAVHAQGTEISEVCRGTVEVWMYNGNQGDVLSAKRDATLKITMTAPNVGSLAIEAGGETLTYSGALYLDGGKDETYSDPDSGDKAIFNLKQMNEKMDYRVSFVNKTGQEVGGMRPGSLTCSAN